MYDICMKMRVFLSCACRSYVFVASCRLVAADELRRVSAYRSRMPHVQGRESVNEAVERVESSLWVYDTQSGMVVACNYVQAQLSCSFVLTTCDPPGACVGGILTIGYIRLGSFRAFTPHDPEIVLDEDRREIAEKLDDFVPSFRRPHVLSPA